MYTNNDFSKIFKVEFMSKNWGTLDENILSVHVIVTHITSGMKDEFSYVSDFDCSEPYTGKLEKYCNSQFYYDLNNYIKSNYISPLEFEKIKIGRQQLFIAITQIGENDIELSN